MSKCDDIIESLLKKAPSVSKYDQAIEKYEKLLKRLNDMKSLIEKSDIRYQQSSRVPVQGLPAGWTRATQPDETGSVTFHHPTDDPITVERHQGGFRIRHRGGVVNKAPSMHEAGKMVGEYIKNLPNKSVNIYDRPSPNMPAPGMPIPTKMAPRHQNILKSQEDTRQTQTENLLASQLADLLQGKSMLGAPVQGITQEAMVKKAVAAEDWISEASKPISQRFSSEEEEASYWDSIKVADREDDDFGY